MIVSNIYRVYSCLENPKFSWRNLGEFKQTTPNNMWSIEDGGHSFKLQSGTLIKIDYPKSTLNMYKILNKLF